jgi:hypothetical protein
LYSYYRKAEKEIHCGGATVEFKKDTVVLYEGYEYADSDGDRILEGEDYYTIPGKFIERLLFLIPEEYKNESILSEYENVYDYYNSLTSDSEKILFICILKYYKIDLNFNKLLKILDDYDIYYEHHEMRYP